ncbi:LysR family transcriptional regulator, partial [Escherichia coli]
MTKLQLKYRELKIISVIAASENISHAATVLGIAQANVSKYLADFESKVGLKVFDRTTRQLMLTPFGTALLPYINDMLDRNEQLNNFIADYKQLDEGHRLAALWQALPEELRLSPHRYLATNSPQGPWWLLGWCERVPEADEVLPAPLPPYRVLTGLVDRFGRTQTFHREA